MGNFVVSLSKMLEIDVASLAFVVALTSTAIAGIIDLRRCYIPNWLTLGLIVSGLLFHVLMPGGRGWVFSLAGFGFGFAVLLPLFVRGGVGGADVKLLAGIGSWVGIHDVMAIFLVFGFLTGVYALSLIVFTEERGGVLRRIANRTSSSERIDEVVAQDPTERKRRVIPMAPAMAIAILVLAVVP